MIPFFPAEATRNISSKTITKSSWLGSGNNELATSLIELLKEKQVALTEICEHVDTMVRDKTKKLAINVLF
jgi:hypothetical protein